jgi:hypothetical protein
MLLLYKNWILHKVWLSCAHDSLAIAIGNAPLDEFIEFNLEVIA